MSPLLAPILGIVDKVFDRILPDPQKKAEMQLEIIKLEQAGQFKEMEMELQKITGQLDINKEEARHQSRFVSGWRPFIGWVCGGGLFYQLIFRPIGGWVMEQWLKWEMPPSLEMDTLLTLLFGMLGLGAYRTYEKVKGRN